MALESQVENFLQECERSGDAAYAALKVVLERLQAPVTRSEARRFLAFVHRHFDSREAADACSAKYHFRMHDVLIGDFEGYQKRKRLIMIEIPSIFIPEDWSFTFYEGINRHPDSIFKDKIVAELGCGNGWISIALAEKWSPQKVYGLDINPRAIKVAWLNLFLNALDENGDPIYDSENKTLLDKVEFYESDLLSYCMDNKIELDCIVGCIPQVLNPNPEAMSKMITENASEEFLYSLSNYCALQGFVEDQFGLGLIARAAEEGIAVIKPTGIMVFNIGGRPGQGVCKRLFERRGFQITKLWQTKVIQAADTDISSLVEIENDSPHRFEFFMGLAGNQPICARTAWAYGLAGGCISHSLSVYSCQLRQPHQVKKIFDFLKNGYHEVSNSLDLSFDDDSVADEKIPFLAYLSSVFKEISSFPYDPPAGNMHFRKLITRFMKIYHHIPLSVDNVNIFLSRAVAIENFLRLFSPRLAIIDEHLTRHLPKQWLTSLAIKSPTDYANGEDTIIVIEAPGQSDLMIQLIDMLKPQVVVTGMAHFEAITSSAFENLLQTTRNIDCRLFLDLSEHLELSSMPGSNGVLKYLSENTLPPHAAIFCGLVKNKVYSDLEVAFVISEDNHVSEALSKVVELLEGHTALISQYYYGCLFHELLAFQIADRHPPSQRRVKDTKPAKLIGFTSSAISSLNAAELTIVEPKHHPFVHMDVDQSFLPIPSVVKSSVFESFARQNMAESEFDVRSGIQQLIKDSHGFSIDNSCEIICGNSSQSLFSKLVLCCIREEGTFLFPSGTNGCYVTTAKFLKANTLLIPTQLSTGCKLVPKQLASLLGTVKTPWVYISGPTISPTGLLYSNNEIHELLSVCANFGARVVIDTTFSGLEFRTEDWTRWDLQSCLSELPCLSSSFSLCLLGGLSFELLTGGLEFGYLILTEPLLTETFYSFPSLNKPHCTIRYAMKRLLALKEQKAKQYLEAISEHKQILKNRSQRLNELLSSCGWNVIPSCGGISMVAKPSAYLGKMVKMDSYETKIEGSNIREAVLRATGLCINSGCWTGIPDFCRFNIALEPNEFERALVCLTHFNNLVLKA